MGRPKTSQHWIGRIQTLTAEKTSAAKILERFETEAEQGGRNDYPLKRTIEREVKKFHALRPDEQRQFALFRWPESMLIGALPWEASSDALDLLRLFDEDENEARPTVRATLWYWRVKQARPDIGQLAALNVAAYLSAYEITRDDPPGEDRVDAHSDELKLAYHPWRSAEDGAAYTARTGENPRTMMRDLTDPRVYQEVMEASLGYAAADRIRRRHAKGTSAGETKEDSNG